MSREAVARARAGVVRRLRARRGEIDAAIFARVSDQWFDRTGSEDPEYVAGMRAAGAAALDFALVGIERSGESLEPAPAAVLTQARRAARVGVGLETVLRRYLAGYTVLEGFVIQEAERGEQRTERGERDWVPPTRESLMGDVLKITSVLADRLIAAVSTAYGEEIERRRDSALDGKEARRTSGRNGGRGRGDPNTGDTPVQPNPVQSPAALEGTQRERIVAAIVEVVAERGCARASVKPVVERAKVSRLTFYKVFPGGLEEGLIAVMDMGLERVGALVSRALEREQSWRDGMRSTLAATLSFFDSEPDLARVLIVETLGGGHAVLEHREALVDTFRALVVAKVGSEVPQVSPLAAEGALASVMSVVRARLIAREPRPLIELLGPLMGLVVEQVADRRTAAEETRRGERLARAIQAGEVSWAAPKTAPAPCEPALSAALANPTARRLRGCVLFLADQGERGLGPNNREVGAAIGVCHKSQISRLLSQLREEDLAVKRSAGPGRPNEWRLTPRGEAMARALAGRED
jgi:AcrR family transcriptional regulator